MLSTSSRETSRLKTHVGLTNHHAHNIICQLSAAEWSSISIGKKFEIIFCFPKVAVFARYTGTEKVIVFFLLLNPTRGCPVERSKNVVSHTNKSQNKYFQIKLKIQESFSDYHSVKLLRIGHRYNDLQSDLTQLSIWATTFTCFRFSFSFSSDRIVLIKVIECTARQKIKTIKHSIEIRHDAYHPS